MKLSAVASVHNLHPRDYGTHVVTKEWLVSACLRQHKFVTTFPMEQLNY
jgi:hypothetical protein